MNFNEIKDLSVVELQKKKKDLVQQLFDAKIKNSIGQLSNPLVIRVLRRDIARLNTVLVKKVAR